MDTRKYKQITLTGLSGANLSMSFHVYKHNVFTKTSEFLHVCLPAIFSNCIIGSLPLSQAPCQPPLILSKLSVLFYRALKKYKSIGFLHTVLLCIPDQHLFLSFDILWFFWVNFIMSWSDSCKNDNSFFISFSTICIYICL